MATCSGHKMREPQKKKQKPRHAKRRNGEEAKVRFWAAALASTTICCKKSSEMRYRQTRRNDWCKLENWQSDSTPTIKNFEYLGTEIDGRNHLWNSVCCSVKMSLNFVAQTCQSGEKRRPSLGILVTWIDEQESCSWCCKRDC